MAGHTNFNELRASLSPQRRRRNQKETQKQIQNLLLSELRKLEQLSQKQLAVRLGVTQPAVAKLESQNDIQVSTLRRIIEVLGGRLEIIAHLPGGDYRVGQFSPNLEAA